MSAQQRHRTDHEGSIAAWLQGAASRWASLHGWTGPTDGAEMDEAVAELRDCATVGRRLRTELLAREAGVCLGAHRARAGKVPTGPYEVMAQLLLAAGGDAHPELVEEAAQDTHRHMAPAGFREWITAQAARSGPRN